jgi:hypothetical protein
MTSFEWWWDTLVSLILVAASKVRAASRSQLQLRIHELELARSHCGLTFSFRRVHISLRVTPAMEVGLPIKYGASENF